MRPRNSHSAPKGLSRRAVMLGIGSLGFLAFTPAAQAAKGDLHDNLMQTKNALRQALAFPDKQAGLTHIAAARKAFSRVRSRAENMGISALKHYVRQTDLTLERAEIMMQKHGYSEDTQKALVTAIRWVDACFKEVSYLD